MTDEMLGQGLVRERQVCLGLSPDFRLGDWVDGYITIYDGKTGGKTGLAKYLAPDIF